MKHGCTITTESMGDKCEVQVSDIPGLNGTLRIVVCDDQAQCAIFCHLQQAKAIEVVPAEAVAPLILESDDDGSEATP